MSRLAGQRETGTIREISMSDAAHNAHSPLTQFEIHPYLPLNLMGYDVSFTNASLWMLVAVVSAFVFLTVGGRKLAVVPGRWQSMAEVVTEFTRNTLLDYCGKDGLKYFPLVFTLFLFILFANTLGMLPGAFTSTSHIIVTFAMAIAVFAGVTLLAIFKHGPIKFMKFFLPDGTPWWMVPLMVPIEVLSYLARPISLSIRLAANMIVGHMILKIAASFVFAMGIFGAWLPFGFIVLFIGFEIGIAMLQAYIFTVLTCVYLHDALHLH